MNSGLSSQAFVQDCRKYVFEVGGYIRDRGATLRFGGGGGGTVSDSILGGGHETPFLTISLQFKNIGGHVPPVPPAPRSLYMSSWNVILMCQNRFIL